MNLNLGQEGRALFTLVTRRIYFFWDLSSYGEDWIGWSKKGGAFKNQNF